MVWEIASRLLSHNNELVLLILPSPATVFKTLCEIAFTRAFLTAVLYTFINVFSGFLFGIVFGVLFGVLTHFSKIFDALISPMMRIIRAVPIVAFIILLYLFFKSNVLPVIIVSLMVVPIMWQTVYDGLRQPNRELLEMARVYNMSKKKVFSYITIPSITPSLLSSAITSLGFAWKSGVAAEVLCLPDISLGTRLWQSKGTVDFDEVYAVTLTVVVISIVLEIILKAMLKRIVERTKYA